MAYGVSLLTAAGLPIQTYNVPITSALVALGDLGLCQKDIINYRNGLHTFWTKRRT